MVGGMRCFRPLTGRKLFHFDGLRGNGLVFGFRPLTGRKLFRNEYDLFFVEDAFSSPDGA